MKKFLFTFGHGQENFPGFHEIEAETELAARFIMYERFGQKWSMLYPEEKRAALLLSEFREIGFDPQTGKGFVISDNRPEKVPEFDPITDRELGEKLFR